MNTMIKVRCPYTGEEFRLDSSRETPFEAFTFPGFLVYAEVWLHRKIEGDKASTSVTKRAFSDEVHDALHDILSDYKDGGFPNARVVWSTATGTELNMSSPSPGTCKAVFSDRPDEFIDYLFGLLGIERPR